MKWPWKRHFPPRQLLRRRVHTQLHHPLCLEPLEDRLAPATLTWVGDVDGNWNTNSGGNTNWSGNALPASGDTLIFDNTAVGNFINNNDTTAGNTYGIQFSATTPYVISGNNITLDGTHGVTNSSTNLMQLNTGLILTGTVTFDATFPLSLGGVISGTGALAKNNSGTLILAGANVYDGDTTINAGTLELGNSNVIPDGPGKGNVAIAGPGRLDLAGFSETINGLSGSGIVDILSAGSSTLTAGGNNQTSTFGGTVQDTSGTLGLTKTGTGTLTLSNTANTYAGQTTIGAGALSVSKLADGGFNSSLGAPIGGNATILLGSAAAATLSYSGGGDSSNRAITVNGAGGGVIQSAAPGTLTLSGGINNAGNPLTFDTLNGTIDATGVISGAGGLTKIGPDALLLSNIANTYTGQTTISAGTLSVLKLANGGVNSSLGAASGGNATILLGSALSAALEYSGGNDSSNRPITINGTGGGEIEVTAPGTLTLTGAIANGGNPLTLNADVGDMNVAGLISGAGDVTKDGQGIVTLSNSANTYTGQTKIVEGLLSVSKLANGGVNSSLGAASGGNATILLGTQAKLLTGNINGPGTGYTVGDILTVLGGTFSTQAKLLVDAVGGSGDILDVQIIDFGQYTVLPASPASVNGGTGGGATFDLPAVVNTAGSGYNLGDILTIQGGTSTTQAQLQVTGVGGSGDITAVSVFEAGEYSIIPVNPVSVTGGTGTLARFNVGFRPPPVATLSYSGGTDSTDRAITMATPAGGAVEATAAGTLTLGGAIDNGGSLLTFNANTGNISASGVISGTGGLTKTGTGTLTLSGTNTYAGASAINAGAVNIQNAAALGFTAAGTTVANGAQLDVQGGIAVGAEALTLNGTGTGGAGALRNVSGTNSLAGAITQAGNTTIGSSAGALTLSGAINNGGNALTFDANSGDISASGVVSGAGGLTKTGTGKLTLSGANTYSGATAINAGTLNIQNATALGSTAAGTTVLSGAQLDLQGSIAVGAESLTLNGSGVASAGALRNVSGINSFAGVITPTGAITIGSSAGALSLSSGINNGGNALTFDASTGSISAAGVISGAGTLTKTGSGTLTLSNVANTYTGQTTIAAGVLSVSKLADGGVNSSLGAASGASATILLGSAASATLSYSGGGSDTSNRAITINGAGGGIIQTAAALTLTLSGAIANGGNLLTFDAASGLIDVTGVVSGTGGLTKTGSGNLTLTTASTYTGATIINAGTLATAASDFLSNSTDVTVSGGTFAMGANSDTVNSLHLVSGSVTGTTGVLTTANAFDLQNGSISAILNGNVALTKTTAGTVTLTGVNTYTGATTVSGGTLAEGVSNVLPDGTDLTVSGGGTLDMGASSDTVNSVHLTDGGITSSSGVLTSLTDYDVRNGLISAVLAGSVGLTKTTAATVTLAGANTYTGATVVNQGTLIINGSIVSAVSLVDTATLGGSGTVVDLSAVGATVSPGNSPGLLNTGNFALQNSVTQNATLVIELNGTSVGTGYDQVNVTGTVTLAGATLNASLGFTQFSLNPGNRFTIINNDGADPVSGTFTGLAEGTQITIGVRPFTISYVGGTGNDIVLTALSSAVTWDGGGSDNNWTTPDNWGTFAAIPGDTLTFGGTLRPTPNNNYQAGSLFDAITLNTDGFSIGGNAIAIAGAITNSSGANQLNLGIAMPTALTVSVAAGSLTLGGALSGTAATLTKSGVGTLILGGTSSYTGATTLSAGALLVNGSIASSSAVTVNAGTLGGAGTLPAVTIAAGALDPGAAASTAILNSQNLALAAASTFSVLLNGTVAGTGHDQLNVSGTVNLGGATLSTTLGYAPVLGDTFTIISNDGTDPVTGTFAGLAEGATFSISGNIFHISYVGGPGNNDVVLTIDSAAPTVLAITTPSQTVDTGHPSALILVELRDPAGNPAKADSGGLSLTLSSDSAPGIFLDGNGQPLAGDTLTVAAGASTAVFEYQDSDVGTPTITVTAAGLSSATQTLDVLDLPDLPGNKRTFTDSDGDKVTVQLVGAGTVAMHQVDPAGNGPIDLLSLQGTSAATSKLLVSVVKAAAGDGRVSIGAIQSSSALLGISAAAANIVGAGITVTGTLGSLTVRDVSAGAVIKSGGTAAQKTSIIAHVFQDDTTVDVSSSLTLLQAAAIGDAVIKTPSIGVLKVPGDAVNKVNGILTPIAGDFAADLILTGTGDPLKPTSLGLAAIAGSVVASNWQITGNIGTVTVTRTVNNWTVTGSAKLAALSLGDVTDADIRVTGSIGSVTAKRWSAGSISAATLTALSVVGNPLNKVNGVLTPIPGDFNAGLALTGDPLKPMTLARATVAGAISDALWQVAGDSGPVSVRGLISSWSFQSSGRILGLTLGEVASATVQAGKKIGTVTAAKGWAAGSLTAGSVNVLRIIGDLGADVALTGIGVTPGLPTLNLATITRTVTGSTLTVAGIVNAFTTGAFIDSQLFAGFAPTDPANPMAGGSFTTGSKINSFKAIGFTGVPNTTFANSTVAASTVGTVSLLSVQGDNTDKLFGVLADTSILSVIVKTPAFTFNKTLATPQGFDEFQVVIL